MWFAVIFLITFSGDHMLYIAPRQYVDHQACIEAALETAEALKEHVASVTVGCSRIDGRGA